VTARLALASFKLRFHDVHVRAVPARDLSGCPFAGPGVDLRGENARAVLTEVAPIRGWLEAREPGIVLRSLSMDLVKSRVLITLFDQAANQAADRPRVLRFDPPSANELEELAQPLLRALEQKVEEALQRRAGADRR